MKIASWNLNSIRARHDHVVKWLTDSDTDILCLQETKVTNEEFPKQEFEEMGYHLYIHGQKAYNGVAIFSKHELKNIRCGFPDGDLNQQARIISAQFELPTASDEQSKNSQNNPNSELQSEIETVTIINVYVPQGDNPDSEKFVMKEEFYAKLRTWLDDEYDTTCDNIIICGDFNIAPEVKDVHDPEKLLGRCGFHPEEHKWLSTLMNWGLTDSFRIHNQEEQIFSWWDYRMNSFKRNKGMRIDYLLVSEKLSPKIQLVGIDPTPRGWERPSDHVPVWLEI